MITGEITVIGRLVDASNATLLCEIEPLDESIPTIKLIYKPIAGERPLWDFPDGGLARREVAAYLFSERMELGVVPPTLLREGPFGEGSLQLWVEVDESVDIVSIGQSDHEDIRKIAFLDVLINNTDRKFGHILPDSSGRIFGCDHGLTFHSDDKLRTVIWQFAGQPISESERCKLGELLASGFDEALLELISQKDHEALLARAEKFLNAGRYPFPSDEWPSVPWPPF